MFDDRVICINLSSSECGFSCLSLLYEILECFCFSQSQLVEKAVYELVDTMKGNLNAKEKAALEEGEGSSETDCYYALLNYFTQRNTEALVKCMNFQHMYKCFHSKK